MNVFPEERASCAQTGPANPNRKIAKSEKPQILDTTANLRSPPAAELAKARLVAPEREENQAVAVWRQEQASAVQLFGLIGLGLEIVAAEFVDVNKHIVA